MHFKNYIISKYNFIVALGSIFLFASCGSYQYVGYDNDGIYDTDQSGEVVYQDSETITTDPNNSTYYKNYFKEKSDEIDGQEGEIFTDIDSYQGSSTELQQEYTQEVNTGYGGWGQNGSEVAINIYGNQPFYGGFYGFCPPFAGGLYSGFYVPGFGYRYAHPFAYGFRGYGFGYGGLGLGYGGLGFGYGFGYPLRPNRYGYPYSYYRYNGSRHYGNSLSYNSGRRSSSAQLGRRNNTSETERRRNSLNTNSRSRVSSDGTILRRPRTEISRNGVGVSPNRRGNRVNTPNRSNNRTVAPNRGTRTRTVTPRRSSNNYSRSSSTRSRSTPQMRSSSPSRGNSSSSMRSSSPRRSSSSTRSSSSSSRRSSGSLRRNN